MNDPINPEILRQIASYLVPAHFIETLIDLRDGAKAIEERPDDFEMTDEEAENYDALRAEIPAFPIGAALSYHENLAEALLFRIGKLAEGKPTVIAWDTREIQWVSVHPET